MARVAALESVLFVGTSVLVAVITTTYRGTSVLLGRVERGVGVAFGLAGVRALLWAAGARVGVENLVKRWGSGWCSPSATKGAGLWGDGSCRGRKHRAAYTKANG